MFMDINNNSHIKKNQQLNNNDEKKKIKLSPYNNKNYNFITQKSIDIKKDWIKYASNTINRPKYIFEINKEINDITSSIKIESSIFEYSLVYCKDNNYEMKLVPDIYQDKFNTIITNISSTNKVQNKTFKKSISQKFINLPYIAFLSPSQIHPDAWASYINKIKFNEERENDVEFSDIFKCKNCGESKSRVSQKQTRCADEPPTTFVKCLVCGNMFKFS